MRHVFSAFGLSLAMLLDASPAGAGAPPGIADLAVDKSAPGTVAPDTDLFYTVAVSNGGPDAAVSTVFTDPLPAGLTFVSITQDSGPAFACSDPGVGNGGSVTCSIASLAAGAGAQFTLVAHVPAGTAPGSVFTNIASASTATFDPNDKNNSAVATTFVPGQQADVAVQKTGPDNAGADTDVVYAISVGNIGPDAAAGFSLDDTLPGDLTFVSLQQTSGPAMSCTTPAVGSGGTIACTLAVLAPGATASFQLVAHVPAGTPSGSSYTNVANVSATTPDANPDNDTSTTTVFVASADLSVIKSGPATVAAGDQATYTITVANAGPDVAGSVTLSDALPAPLTFVSLTQVNGPVFNCTGPGVGNNGTVTCTTAQLGIGASAQFTLVAQVPANAPSRNVQNTAQVSSSTYDGNLANDTSLAETMIIGTVDITVSKTAAASVVAGDNLVYTILLANNGPDAAANVLLEDVLQVNTTFVSFSLAGNPMVCNTPPAGSTGTITCSRPSLEPGVTITLTVTVRVAPAAPHGSSVTNTVNVLSASTESNSSNNTATSNTIVTNAADLTLSKSAVTSVGAGQQLVYTIVLGNSGPSPANSVSVTDMLPGNTSFVALAQAGTPLACTTPAVGSGGTVECNSPSFARAATTTLTLTVLVSNSAANGSFIINAASVSTSTVDPLLANNSTTATSTVSNTADLGITKTASGTALASTTLSYTLAAGNAGPLSDSATITDTLPAGVTFQSITQTSGPVFACTTPAVGAGGNVTCTLAAFPAAASAGFVVNVLVSASNPTGTVLNNVASIDGARIDPNPANDSATASTTVDNPPDLALTKTGPGNLEPNATFAYTLDLGNIGTGAALDVVLTDALPAQTRFVSLVQNMGPVFACTTPAVGANGTVSCSLAAMPAGAAARFTLTVSLAAGANGSVTNTANVTTSSADAGTGNNASSAASGIGFGPSTTPITIPTLSWFGLLALVLAVGLFGAAIVARSR